MSIVFWSKKHIFYWKSFLFVNNKYEFNQNKHHWNWIYISQTGVVDFATYDDMKRAIDKMDDTELNGRRIKLVPDGSFSSRSRSRSRSRGRSRSRSRSARRSRWVFFVFWNCAINIQYVVLSVLFCILKLAQLKLDLLSLSNWFWCNWYLKKAITSFDLLHFNN